MGLSADQPATPTSSHSCACSVACQQVHTHCRGCGVLEGPDHVHRLRDGYCYTLLMLTETGAPTLVPVVQSCWSVRERLPPPLAVCRAPARRARAPVAHPESSTLPVPPPCPAAPATPALAAAVMPTSPPRCPWWAFWRA